MIELRGLRVLVVEDEAMVAMLIEDILEDLGCQLVASIASLAAAREAAACEQIDFAVLDVNVAGELVFPVAEALRNRQIPFLLAQGMELRDCHRRSPLAQS
jgi:CheY-like chemotaxis protein